MMDRNALPQELSRGQLLAMTNLIALRVRRWSAMYGGEQRRTREAKSPGK
jgi:hypothetical protein